MKFEPNIVFGSAGDRIRVALTDDTGNTLPINDNRCVVFTSPDRTSANIIDFGKRLYPVMIKLIDEDTLEIIVTGDCPSCILYRDPITRQTATLDMHITPFHDHRSISHGGPAVSSFEVFQL